MMVQLISPDNIDDANIENVQNFVNRCHIFSDILAKQVGDPYANILRLYHNLEKITINYATTTNMILQQDSLKMKTMTMNQNDNALQIDIMEYQSELIQFELYKAKITWQGLRWTDQLPTSISLTTSNDVQTLTGLDQFPFTDKIYISDTLIKQLQILITMQFLKSIHINSCKYLCQFVGIEKCPFLESIQITHTQLEQLTFSSPMNYLKRIALNQNVKLTEITGLKFCPCLQSLNIAQSAIQVLFIPNKLTGLKSLVYGGQQIPQIKGCENLQQLQNLFIEETNNQTLQISHHWVNLTCIDLFWCKYLGHVIGLDNCYQLEKLRLNKQIVQTYIQVDDENQNKRDTSQIFVSVPETELVVFNSILEKSDLIGIQQNKSKVQTLTLLKCDCLELVQDTEAGMNLITLLQEKFQPKYLTVTNCSNTNVLSDYLNRFEKLVLKYNEITDLSFIIENNKIQQLIIGNCLQLTDCDNIKFCQQLKQLVIKDSSITNLNFIPDNSNLRVIELENCTQLVCVNYLKYCHNLQSISIINTFVKDFSSLLQLTNIRHLNLSNNYKQQNDYLFDYGLENLDQLHSTKKLTFVKKQIKQTNQQIFYIIKSIISQNDDYLMQIRRRFRGVGLLCIDIIKRMIELQE